MSKVCCAISIAVVNAVLAYSAKNDPALNDELFRAIRNNDTPSVKTLLRRGAGVNAKDKDGATPLMQAALYGDPGMLMLLLDKGADPNAHNKVGATALLWSVHDLRKVRLLVPPTCLNQILEAVKREEAVGLRRQRGGLEEIADARRRCPRALRGPAAPRRCCDRMTASSIDWSALPPSAAAPVA